MSDHSPVCARRLTRRGCHVDVVNTHVRAQEFYAPDYAALAGHLIPSIMPTGAIPPYRDLIRALEPRDNVRLGTTAENQGIATRSGSSVSLTDATRLEDIRGPLITPPEGDTAVVRRWVREFASATGMADLLYEFDKLLARGAGNADQQLITTLAIACEKPE